MKLRFAALLFVLIVSGSYAIDTNAGWVSVGDYDRSAGETDDSGRIQRALLALNAQPLVNQGVNMSFLTIPISDGKNATVGYYRTLHFPKGIYTIGETIQLSVPGSVFVSIDIDGNGAILQPKDGNQTNYFIEGPELYRARIHDLQFVNATNCLNIYNPNWDMGMIAISNCTFTKIGGTAIKIACQSSKVDITNCTFADVVHVLDTTSDGCTLSNSWISQGKSIGNFDACIVARGSLTMREVLCVPAPLNPVWTDTAWVANYGQLEIVACRFGGEEGSRTIVNNYAQGLGVSSGNGYFGVTIRDSQCYQVNGDAVRLFAVPNQLILTGNRGFVDSSTMMWASSMSTAAKIEAVSLAGGPAKLVVDVKDNVGKDQSRANYILPELVATPGITTVSNTTGNGNYSFTFDLGLVPRGFIPDRAYLVKIRTHSWPDSGSVYYSGEYVGVLTVTAEYMAPNPGDLVYRLHLTPLVNNSGGPSPANYAPSITFAATQTDWVTYYENRGMAVILTIDHAWPDAHSGVGNVIEVTKL